MTNAQVLANISGSNWVVTINKRERSRCYQHFTSGAQRIENFHCDAMTEIVITIIALTDFRMPVRLWSLASIHSHDGLRIRISGGSVNQLELLISDRNRNRY
jgi:hypothetical protein